MAASAAGGAPSSMLQMGRRFGPDGGSRPDGPTGAVRAGHEKRGKAQKPILTKLTRRRVGERVWSREGSVRPHEAARFGLVAPAAGRREKRGVNGRPIRPIVRRTMRARSAVDDEKQRSTEVGSRTVSDEILFWKAANDSCRPFSISGREGVGKVWLFFPPRLCEVAKHQSFSRRAWIAAALRASQ